MYAMSSVTGLPVANPTVMFREEFDDWAVLFDPDTGEGFGLNPVSAFVWKHLDGRHGIDDILAELAECCEDVPLGAREHITALIEDMSRHGLVGYEMKP
jgi:SynChlorMet cassette protein ScmD